MRQAYANGIAWGEAKILLFERIERDVAPMRERYEALMAEPAHIEAILQAGAKKARAIAQPLMQQLRSAVGLRSLAGVGLLSDPSKPAGANKRDVASFKQYRESDGQFYFKLTSSSGEVLLQSLGYAMPKAAGQAIAQLQGGGLDALAAVGGNLQPLSAAQRARALTELQAIAVSKNADDV